MRADGSPRPLPEHYFRKVVEDFTHDTAPEGVENDPIDLHK